MELDPHSRLAGATGVAHESATAGRDAVPEPAPTPERYRPYEHAYAHDPAGNVTRTTEVDQGALAYDPVRSDLLLGTVAEAAAGAYVYDGGGNAVRTPRVAPLVHDHRGSLRYAAAGDGQVHLRGGGHHPGLRIARRGQVVTLTARLGPLEYVAVRGDGEPRAAVSLRVGGGTPEALVRRTLLGSADDAVLGTHTDELGSVTAVTAAAGALEDRESYFPYGRASDRRTDRDGPRFLGLDREPVTGLYLTGPRVYDAVIGRFLQPDPRGPEQLDWSPYAYGKASPLQFTDRSGAAPGLPWLGFTAVWYGTTEPDAATGAAADRRDRAEVAGVGAYKALELMVSPAVDVSNAPTGESVDVDGDDFGMAFGLLVSRGPPAPGSRHCHAPPRRASRACWARRRPRRPRRPVRRGCRWRRRAARARPRPTGC